jgi:hypothetical protein
MSACGILKPINEIKKIKYFKTKKGTCIRLEYKRGTKSAGNVVHLYSVTAEKKSVHSYSKKMCYKNGTAVIFCVPYTKTDVQSISQEKCFENLVKDSHFQKS